MARPRAGRAGPPRPGLRAGGRAALSADPCCLSCGGGRRADRRHRLSLRGDPRCARAGSRAPGGLGQPGEPVALPATVGSQAAGCGLRQSVQDMTREIENAWIPLKDGTRLAARLWLPDDAERNPVPALLEYLP